MRITNTMMIGNVLSDINRNMNRMDKYQYQLATGRRIQYISDDPIGIMTILDSKNKLRKLDMHNACIDDANSWLTETESALKSVNNVIDELYVGAEYAANGTMTATDKLALCKDVEQLRQHLVQLGNSTYGGGRYIFGGYNTTSAPFAYDAFGVLQYNNVDLVTAPAATVNALQAQVIRYNTGVNVTTDVSINGVDLMGTGANNLNQILLDYENALNTNAPSAVIEPFVGLFQQKQQDVLTLLADVGGRISRLDWMTATNSDDEFNYTQVLSKVEDVDQAEATMGFKMAEAVYRSALQVGAKVIQPTLLDFLR